jgi:hypothetical protein
VSGDVAVSGSISSLLARCHLAGLTLTAEGDKLHVDYEHDPPTALIEELRRHKVEVMCALDGRAAERAAIVEYGAAVPRSWAEGFARLDPARPPADVPLRRWQQFIDDVGRFLDSGFAEKATALGWGAFDIFGCDRDKPFARIDRQGMCWLIAGNRLVDLSEDRAIIQTWTGQHQTSRRKPSEAGRVLAWELADGTPGGEGV